MNKQKLMEKYGLTEEQAQEIVASLDGAYVAKDRFNQVNESLKVTKGELTEAQKQIGVLEKDKAALDTALQAKADDPNALSALQKQLAGKEKEIADLKTGHQQVLDALKLDHAIEAQLLDAHDPSIALGQINREGLVLAEDGKTVTGLEERIKALREQKAFLFKGEETPAQPNKLGFTPFESGGRMGGAKVGRDAYLERLTTAKTSMERIQIKNEAFADGVVLE